MALKLSTSLIRPFGFSFSRPNTRLVSGPIFYHSHQQCCRHYQYTPNASSRLAMVPRMDQQMVYTRSMASDAKSKNQSQPESVINNDSDAVLLTKSAPQEEECSDENHYKPTEEQLQLIADKMGSHLPQFFKVPHDFRMYNRNIVFEDNIRNVRAVGLNQYAWQIALIKMGAHFKYGKVTMNLLKITKHTEDGTVRVRWRIEIFPGNRIVLAFWQFKLWNTKESLETHTNEWIDGFSIFQVGGDGLIHKHICDKVIPDTDKVETKKDTNLAMKLGLALGLIPGEHFVDDLLMKISEILSNL